MSETAVALVLPILDEKQFSDRLFVSTFFLYLSLSITNQKTT